MVAETALSRSFRASGSSPDCWTPTCSPGPSLSGVWFPSRRWFTAGIGCYLLGVPGALAATLGIVLSSCVNAAGGALGLQRMGPLFRRLELPARFVIAGLIAAAAWMTASPMEFTVLELVAVAVVTLLVGRFRTEPALVLLAGLFIGVVWSWLALQ